MNTELMEDLYAWVDRIPFSRPKKDLKRDFSDGVLIAELVKHFFPSYVDLHNYPSALGVNNKIANWKILNRKVFRKLKFEISEDVIRSIVTCQPNAIQQFLLLLRCKIESILNCDLTKHEVDHPKIMRDIQEDNCSGEHIMKKNSSIGKNDKKVAYQEGATGNQGEIINNIQQILVNKEAELFSKDEMIDVLKARVRKLENMLELKDTHIRELQKILKKNASQAQVGAPTELTTH